MLTGITLDDSYGIPAGGYRRAEREADMQNPQMGGEISGAKIRRLQEEALQDERVRLARHHRRELRRTGAWRQAVGMHFVDAGIRMIGPSTETNHGVEVR
jgi:hypothetical protein